MRIRILAELIGVAALITSGNTLAQSQKHSPQSVDPISGLIAAAENAPTILSENDVRLYQDIFSLQKNGRWKQADAKISLLENDLLMGHAQFQRYMHPTAYRSTYPELKKWMAFYADHPEAAKIYKLALKRRPKRAGAPIRPISRKWRTPEAYELHPALKADYERTNKGRVRQIEGRVRYLIKRKQASNALKEIKRHHAKHTITERQFDRMRSWIAASLYYQGYVGTAKRIASEAAVRNGDTASMARWIAGLIAFREGNLSTAHDLFAAMASVSHQEKSLRAAAGFWAARTALADGHFEDVTPNLEIAANFPFTFYGQLALAQLGRDYEFNWTPPTLDGPKLTALKQSSPAIARTIALKQIGKSTEADLELRWINGAFEPPVDRNLLALAMALDLPAAQIDIALSGDAKYLEPGLYPIPAFAPEDGFSTDRALLYGLMRQESKFKVEATSRVGARGLMQLMPRTASFVAKDRSLRRGEGRNQLYDPGLNLKIGQSYVKQLISNAAEGNLFHMAVAYNGGPGNLRRWKRDVEISDPLLFIESIPNTESRDFVEKVLTNVWIYRARLGQAAPTRDKVAAGQLPLYEALDQIAGE